MTTHHAALWLDHDELRALALVAADRMHGIHVRAS